MDSRVQAIPDKVCLLRLSAIGDTCHVVPLLRTLQDAWPKTRFTWVIGKLEAKLMSLIPDVELITVDKGAGLSAYSRLRTDMKRRGAFDLLLHLQLSMRASGAAALIPAPVKLGFDKPRARELQWLFTNARIAARQREHVLDSFMGFADALGVRRGEGPRWDIPLPSSALAYAEHLIPDSQPTLLISACSSHRLRNWLPERYAALADYAGARHGMRVILCGGPSDVEREMAAAIVKLARTPLVEPGGQGHAAAAARPAVARDGAAHARLRSRAHGDHGEHSGHRPVRRHQPRAQRALSFAPLVRGRLRCGGAQVPGQARERAALDHEDRSAGRHGAHRSAGRHREAR